MAEIVNLTPHNLSVLDDSDHPLITFARTSQVARVREVSTPGPVLLVGETAVPLLQVRYAEEIIGLPGRTDGVFHLVSRVTAAASDRDDLLFPHDEVRNAEGQIIGCRALGTFHDLTGGC